MDKPVRVEIPTLDGVTLRGDFYKAERGGAPAVAMSGGLTLLKEHGIRGLAEQFQAAGISALAYDHRSFGSSDGEPRQHTNPDQHSNDYHDAARALSKLPGVDPERVAIWGIGHSACWVMMAAAQGNPRLKAAVFHRPIYSGAKGAEVFPEYAKDVVWQDREDRISDGEGEYTYIKAWPDSLENAEGAGQQAVVPGVAAYHLIQGSLPESEAAGTPWENKISLQSIYHLMRTEAADYLPKVKIPALYIVAEDDPFGQPVAWQREAYERMGSNADFIVSAPASSGVSFDNFPVETDQAIDFLRRSM